jgi:hypothetical protein
MKKVVEGRRRIKVKGGRLRRLTRKKVKGDKDENEEDQRPRTATKGTKKMKAEEGPEDRRRLRTNEHHQLTSSLYSLVEEDTIKSRAKTKTKDEDKDDNKGSMVTY